MTDIDRQASDAMSVAPAGEEGEPFAADPRQEAGQDKSIARRLEKHPESKQAQLDNALDESMDASDPPSTTQPSRGDPAQSSGYNADAEAQRD